MFTLQTRTGGTGGQPASASRAEAPGAVEFVEANMREISFEEEFAPLAHRLG
jgi:hypothetical protein